MVTGETTCGITVTAPALPSAPPGYYMLFVLDQNRIPSASVTVHLE